MNMSHIRSTNSKPEEIVRKYLFAEGFRYRKNVKKLPGCPDIVLPNNSDYLQKARKYGHFTGYKN